MSSQLSNVQCLRRESSSSSSMSFSGGPSGSIGHGSAKGSTASSAAAFDVGGGSTTSYTQYSPKNPKRPSAAVAASASRDSLASSSIPKKYDYALESPSASSSRSPVQTRSLGPASLAQTSNSSIYRQAVPSHEGAIASPQPRRQFANSNDGWNSSHTIATSGRSSPVSTPILLGNGKPNSAAMAGVTSLSSSPSSSGSNSQSHTPHLPMQYPQGHHPSSGSNGRSRSPAALISRAESDPFRQDRGQQGLQATNRSNSATSYKTNQVQPYAARNPMQQQSVLPFRSNFQPQGRRRDRTEEFDRNRRQAGDSKKLEEGRLERRMKKLIALHFPPPPLLLQTHNSTTGNRAVPSPNNLALSSLSSLSEFTGSLRGKSARDLWKSVSDGVNASLGMTKGEIERAEQAIVRWQDDADAQRCPICTLCGRVVCFLPPTPPVPILPSSPSHNSPAPVPGPIRRERCSTFITYEYENRQFDLKSAEKGIQESLGVIVEIEQVEPDLSFAAMMSSNDKAPKEKEKKDERKKVRLCRECLRVVLRQQTKRLPVKIPPWMKLYEVLVQLEKEIEEVLPEFQELILGLQKPSMSLTSAHHAPSASAAQSLRKRLLTNLASYDTISKRIRELPLTDEGLPGGSQDRLQRAIAARGTLFLSEKLGLLRSMGNLDETLNDTSGSNNKKGKKGGVNGVPTVKTLASLLGSDESNLPNDSRESLPQLTTEAAAKLAVLQEQESLVQSYLEDANMRRQFEDATSLSASLAELRLEIAKVKGGAV